MQGVGFRPFVFRLAEELGLAGIARNTPQGLLVEVEGTPAAIAAFRERITADNPPLAAIHGVEVWTLDPHGLKGFEIVESDSDGERSPFVLPDIAPCADCLGEIFDQIGRAHV